MPHPEYSFALEELPDGWLPCDGSTIPKGPWTGGKTPDLNSAGLFLRGGEEDAVLEVEEDQVQEHEHDDPGHSHGCSASSTAQPHAHNYNDYFTTTGGSKAYGGSERSFQDYDRVTKATTIVVQTSCSTSSQTSGLGGVAAPSNSGTETRPRNMKVTYVIRCW